MSHTRPERFSALLTRDSLENKRLCTICGKLAVPTNVWADGTHTCSKACGEVKRYNMSILNKGIFAGRPYRSQGARG